MKPLRIELTLSVDANHRLRRIEQTEGMAPGDFVLEAVPFWIAVDADERRRVKDFILDIVQSRGPQQPVGETIQ